jgi:hypothetical protein
VKKTIIALTLVVAIAIALSVTIPAIAATATTTITGHVDKVIEVTATPSSITTWDLTPAGATPGSVSDDVIVTVRSNADWTLKAKDTATAHTGYMVSTSPTANLSSPLTVNGSVLTSEVTLTPGARPGGSQTVTLAQAKSWSDVPSTSYTIVVTFTASND